MKFYFPDSQDLVSPTYDFLHDEYSALRVRQRDDLYAHEVLGVSPYEGLLVSKAIVDGSVNSSGKYSTPQRERLYRLGVRRFFRLPKDVVTLGDCGAFNYVNETKPPYTVAEVLDFYEGCGFDAGVSIDHVILAFEADAPLFEAPAEWQERRTISLELAAEFISAVNDRRSSVEPVGAAQGWSPESYADSVRQLQDMGYRRIAMGGMVPLKTHDILSCLRAVEDIRAEDTRLHLLGITRVDAMEEFARLGVDSFDSTSPFRQAFMDARRNYHTATDAFVAIRVPQSDGNPALKRAILSGRVRQSEAIRAERQTLKALREFGTGSASIETVLDALSEFAEVADTDRAYLPEYARTLEAAPWRDCPCAICRQHGIEVAIFRGTERNKRRGFHNLAVLRERMTRLPTYHAEGSTT